MRLGKRPIQAPRSTHCSQFSLPKKPRRRRRGKKSNRADKPPIHMRLGQRPDNAEPLPRLSTGPLLLDLVPPLACAPAAFINPICIFNIYLN
ncbi:hypothetical protein Ciccas_013991 [Cichlidogyrus casuarinus]|uniref:Uncharacterized protein n=1 Tax=Cichlidogyrus casuarinus TaxID=1844966 RepID=A0ABD2PKX3_9PLAT